MRDKKSRSKSMRRHKQTSEKARVSSQGGTDLAKKIKKEIEKQGGGNYNSGKGQVIEEQAHEEQRCEDLESEEQIREEQRRKDQVSEKILLRIDELRPIDDVFMRCMFRENNPLVQRVLRAIMQMDDLEVVKCETQRDMKRLVGSRSIVLDVYARDSKGRVYDIEIQIALKGADPHRARYHASVLDVENLRAGQDFDELPETYVIFITEEDIYGKGLPVYHVERKIEELDNKPFEDDVHILYVNGQYEGDDPIGILMHDFNCKNPNEMRDDLMRERAKSLKESEKGAREVSSVMDEIRAEAEEYGREQGRKEGMRQGRREGMQKGLRETALRMLSANKYTLDEVVSISGLSLDEVKKLAK